MRSFIIDKLIEIETQAQLINSDSKKEEDEIKERIDENCKLIEQRYKQEYERQLEEFEQKEDSATTLRLKEIKDTSHHKFDDLLKYYEDHRDQWIDEVFRNIVTE